MQKTCRYTCITHISWQVRAICLNIDTRPRGFALPRAHDHINHNIIALPFMLYLLHTCKSFSIFMYNSTNTVWQVIFGGANFCEKLEAAVRSNFCGFNFCDWMEAQRHYLHRVRSMACIVCTPPWPCACF